MRLVYLLFAILIFSCQEKKETPVEPKPQSDLQTNINQEMLDSMQWMNSPVSYNLNENSLSITVDKGTDFFNNPEDGSIAGNAPLLFQKIEGDFVARALVKPDFSSQWNAVSMMIHQDSLNWIKFAFENSDAAS